MARRLKESRQFGRYKISRAITMDVNGTERLASVENESIGGMRIHISDSTGIAIGRPLSIKSDGEELTAYVRNMGPLADGGTFVGVSWDPPIDPASEAPQQDAVSSFFRYGAFLVVCRDLIDGGDQTALVTLWDGATFNTEKTRIRQLCRAERQSGLMATPDHVHVLANLYGVADDEDVRVLQQRVIDFEFPIA